MRTRYIVFSILIYVIGTLGYLVLVPTSTKANPINECQLTETGGLLKRYSLISRNWLGPASVNGNAFVGGNLATAEGLTFGPEIFGPYINPSFPALSLVGDTQSGAPVTIRGGSLYHGGTINREINFIGNGQMVQATSNLEAEKAYIESLVLSATVQLDEKPTNGYYTITPLEGSTHEKVVTLHGYDPSSNGVIVFDLQANEVFNADIAEINLQMEGLIDHIVVNVHGELINWKGSMSGELIHQLWQDRTIWNFPDAKDVFLVGDNEFRGMLFAPKAHFSMDEETPPIQGGLVAWAMMGARVNGIYRDIVPCGGTQAPTRTPIPITHTPTATPTASSTPTTTPTTTSTPTMVPTEPTTSPTSTVTPIAVIISNQGLTITLSIETNANTWSLWEDDAILVDHEPVIGNRVDYTYIANAGSIYELYVHFNEKIISATKNERTILVKRYKVAQLNGEIVISREWLYMPMINR